MYKEIDGHVVSQIVAPRADDPDPNPHLLYENFYGMSEIHAGTCFTALLPDKGWTPICIEYDPYLSHPSTPQNSWGAYVVDYPGISPVGLFIQID